PRSKTCAAPAITRASRCLPRRSIAMSCPTSTRPTAIAEGRGFRRTRMYDIETAIERLSEQTILCIGDLMLDEFVYGEVSAVSPEAPVPVIAARRDEKVIGGAGNVARNIASLGARCLFVSVIGADDTGSAVKSAFGAFRKTIEPHLVVDRSRPTTRKV